MKPLHLAIIAAPVLIATVLAACEPRASRHGQVLDQEAVASIEPGVDHRSEVDSPTGNTVVAFALWRRHVVLHQPVPDHLGSVPSRNRIADRGRHCFDSSGIVEEVAMLTIEDGIVIDPVSRATPTHGRDLGLLEQLLGNIGRFDAPGTTAQFPTP